MFKLMKKINLATVIIAIVFLIVQAACDLYIPTITANIVDRGVAAGDMVYIGHQGGRMIALTITSFIAAVLNAFCSARLVNKFGGILRRDIYQKAMRFSSDEFDKIGISSLIMRNTNDVKQVQTLVDNCLKVLILAPAYMIFGFLFAFRLNASLAMIFIYVMPVLLLLAIGISFYTMPKFMVAQKRTDEMNRIYREGINGVKVIRAFNKEDYEYQRYQSANAGFRDVSIKANTIIGLLAPSLSLIMSLATILIVFLGAGNITAGSLEVGALMGIVSYATYILMGFSQLTMVVTNIPRGMVSAKRINEVLEMPLSITDADVVVIPEAEPSLIFRNVSYSYQAAEKPALKNIDFKILKGQTLAIVGGTGAGKSTLTSLMLRLYDAASGSIVLNGEDLRAIPQKELHQRIGYVPQKSLLFLGTIRSNLLLAKPDATDEELWAALAASDAADFVKAKGGLDLAVEKGGSNFSGGQQQRLCIARAILKKADIYIFDDSFSALDFKTDAKIRQNLKCFLKDSIKVIVAQRISTVADADTILCLNAGTLAGIGTHEYLQEHNEIYREIVKSQSERRQIA